MEKIWQDKEWHDKVVEILDSTIVICSYKTDTSTQNQMIVKEIVAEAIRYYVEGRGYIPKGKFAIIQDNDKNNNINSMDDINNTIVNVASYPYLKNI